MRRVLVPGSFDILHHGHLLMLERCKRLGEVIVALGSDTYQSEYKRDPIQSYDVRKATLEALGYLVVRRDGKCLRAIYEAVRPDYVVRGSDWRSNEAYLEAGNLDWDFIDEHGITLVIVPNEGMTSTTQIIEDVIESSS